MSSDYDQIRAVPAASRGSAKKKKEKEKKKKKVKTTTSVDRSSVIIHHDTSSDGLPEDFVKEYSLDLDQLGSTTSSSPRPLSESSSDGKSDSEDDTRRGQRWLQNNRQVTRPRVLTSSAETISAPFTSEEEGTSSSSSSYTDFFSPQGRVYNHYLSNNGSSQVVVRRNGSTLSPSSRAKAQPPALAALSKDLWLRIFNFLDWKSLCMATWSCSLWRYVCERSGKQLLEQKGVRNILWLFYLLDKIDEQIEIVLLMEEEERKRLAKLEERNRAKQAKKLKNKKKTKKSKKMKDDDERPAAKSVSGKRTGGKKEKEDAGEESSASESDSDSGSDNDGGLTKKAKKRPKKQKKKSKKAKRASIEFDMFMRSGTRIEFLKATVMLLRTYFKQNGLLQKQKIVPMAEYTRLLGILDKQLLETHSVLAQVISGELAMNENFDIIELSLRRYYSDFTLMFSPHGGPNTAYSHPSRIITDDKARRVWEESVGKDVYFCNFKSFYKHVLRQETDLDDKQFKYYMKYFLNFPKDDTVSVAKWNTLTRLFGPYRKFYRTLHRYVMGTGFLGLINRIRAEEILKDYPNHVLIRFSRTAPLLLAFSENKDGVITHSTNGPSARKLLKLPETKDNVPVDIYLRKVFPRSSLIPMKVDGRLVAQKDTYTDYVSTSTGYLCAGEFLWEND